MNLIWLRGLDLNQRPLGYEPNELPGCSTPQIQFINSSDGGQATLSSNSSSNCRNQSRYPILEWGVMNLVYANTGTIAGRIAAGLRILS